MLCYEELRLELLESEKPLKELADAIGLEGLKAEIEKLTEESAQDGFWNDVAASNKIVQKLSVLKSKVKKYEDLSTLYEDTLTLIEMANEEEDDSMLDECRAGVDSVKSGIESQTLDTLLCGEYDSKNAILTFHAGSGGTEAQDWAMMLFRMYHRWGERHGFKTTTLDYLDGEEAGIKSAVILVEGENAFGYLKSEMGIHRLVRVSPFDAQGRRHTSFASLEVMPEIDDTIEVDIRPEDIKMDVYRASGAGGQR